MTCIVTVRLLVDELDDARIADGLNEMLRAAQLPVDDDDPGTPWIVDWEMVHMSPVSHDLEDAIANGTYEEGDFTK